LVLTLTINPAIDRTITVDRLVFEDRGYILDHTEVAGGRGINASRLIHGFGGKTVALLTSGGETGAKMEKSLASMGFPYQIMRVRQESRTNFTISDRQGLTVKLNEIGAPLEAHEVNQIRDLVAKYLTKARWLMICGSLPPGVAPHFFCEVIEMAKKQNVRTLLDSDGDALLHALEAKPSIITPNQPEAERLLGRALITRTQFLDAIGRIQAMGAESVILSLGSRGAIGSGPEGVFEALSPRIDALCPIGAGDALAAALVWSLDKKKPFQEALRWSVAAGTAKAALPGMTFPTLEQTRAINKQVEIRRAA
jgi:1-phosphofructokinase family hexose kinase